MEQAASQFRITQSYDLLLRGTPQVPAGLYQLQLLTAQQLTRLHYSEGMITTVKTRLKMLTKSGVVQSNMIPSRKMRTPYYYTLGKAGVEYLKSVGCDVSESWRASKAVNQNWLFVQHTLELNDVLISALLLHRDDPNVTLKSFEHEHNLKRHPYQATWQSHGRMQTFTVIPDAFLDFQVVVGDSVRRMPVMLEHDRGTEQQLYFRRRIRAYIAFLKTGTYQRAFGTNAVTVVFTTFEGPERVEQMKAWTQAELEGEPAVLGSLFHFSALTQPLQALDVWKEILLAA
jgi:DNA-binding PadR family transcriptional regulator